MIGIPEPVNRRPEIWTPIHSLGHEKFGENFWELQFICSRVTARRLALPISFASRRLRCQKQEREGLSAFAI
ncbi:hypothetical protein Q2941_48865 [Bradyrhizobium sp. UFLA05-153]